MNTDQLNNELSEQQVSLKNLNMPDERFESNKEETGKAKNKKKHHSAALAASLGRSAVNHVDAHRITGLSNHFAHTGTNVSYENL